MNVEPLTTAERVVLAALAWRQTRDRQAGHRDEVTQDGFDIYEAMLAEAVDNHLSSKKGNSRG